MLGRLGLEGLAMIDHHSSLNIAMMWGVLGFLEWLPGAVVSEVSLATAPPDPRGTRAYPPYSCDVSQVFLSLGC